MGQPETILERTDRMLKVLLPAKKSDNINNLEMLWRSSLELGPLFTIGDRRDESAERQAEKIVSRHLKRHDHRPQCIAMAQLVDFQHSLQLRSKVMSAIQMLTSGEN